MTSLPTVLSTYNLPATFGWQITAHLRLLGSSPPLVDSSLFIPFAGFSLPYCAPDAPGPLLSGSIPPHTLPRSCLQPSDCLSSPDPLRSQFCLLSHLFGLLPWMSNRHLRLCAPNNKLLISAPNLFPFRLMRISVMARLFLQLVTPRPWSSPHLRSHLSTCAVHSSFHGAWSGSSAPALCHLAPKSVH